MKGVSELTETLKKLSSLEVGKFYDSATLCKSVAELPELRVLKIGGLDVKCAEFLGKMSKLELVEAHGFIEKEVMEQLVALPNLKHLALRDVSSMRGYDLLPLKTATKIETLELSDAISLNAEWIGVVAFLSGLKTLSLRHTRLDDANIVYLGILPNLETLDISLCPNLTDKGVAAFQQLLPQCKVVR